MPQGLPPGRAAREAVDEAGIASVVPRLTQQWVEMCAKHLGIEAFVVGPGARTGMRIKTRNPSKVGGDRIVNAVAAFEAYGGPCIVADYGTATTSTSYPPRVTPGGCHCAGHRGLTGGPHHPCREAIKVEPSSRSCHRQVDDAGAAVGRRHGSAGQVEGVATSFRDEL